MIAALAAFIAPACAAEPVGLIIAVKGGTVRRAGAQYALKAKPGDALFAGDRITAVEGVRFAFCPSRREYSLEKSTVDLATARVTELEGHFTSPVPLDNCVLPPISAGTESNIRFYVEDLRDSLDRQPPSIAPVLSDEQQANLEALRQAADAEGANVMNRLAYATALSQVGRHTEAVVQYTRIENSLPGAVWTHELQHPSPPEGAPSPVRSLGGITYALVVGISRYPLLKPEDQLQFAAADAADFYKYLTSPAGGVAKQNATLFLGRDATVAAVRHAMATSFAQAHENDTIVLYVADHGIAPVEGETNDAYLLTYDSDPQNLPLTAIRMSEVQELLHGSSRAREVRVFIDACRSGRIGSIVNKGFNRNAARSLGPRNAPSLVLAMLASRAQQTSFECENFKHGAFTYYILRGLSTDEAADPVGRITVDRLFHYVSDHVYEATSKRQTPVANAGLPGDVVLRRDRDTEPAVAIEPSVETVCQSARGRSNAPAAEPEPEAGPGESNIFERALDQGTLKKGEADQAFSQLKTLQPQLPEAEYNRQAAALRVDLENAGQKVLLRYLQGEAVPQTPEMFELCGELFAAAHRLAPGDDYLMSRELFCEGRVQVFQKNYDASGGALDLLEDAIRLDPAASYAYNAIGIALLEKPDYVRAEAALRDAIRLAPYWIYPRHNLALALSERGDYRGAIDVYNAALSLTPRYAYIAYNLGATLQKLNRSRAARDAYNEALALDPGMARAYTGIGLSYALGGSYDKAESSYRKALSILERQAPGEDILTTRHDLALLLAAANPDAAYTLWKANLMQAPDHLPSLLGMAQTYERRGRPEAIDMYERVTAIQDKYVAAHLQLARLLIQSGRIQEAVPHLEQARMLAPEDAGAWELSGDAAAAQGGDPTGARRLYERALRLTSDRTQRSRILKRLRRLGR